MRALVCPELGSANAETLKLESDWPTPELGDNDVLIRVKAAGLNFPDVLQIQGKYQFQPELPFVVGSEIAGVIEAVGSQVSRFKEGDEVISMGGGFRERKWLALTRAVERQVRRRSPPAPRALPQRAISGVQ